MGQSELNRGSDARSSRMMLYKWPWLSQASQGGIIDVIIYIHAPAYSSSWLADIHFPCLITQPKEAATALGDVGLGVAWELRHLRLIDLRELWARQISKDRSHGVGELSERTEGKVRLDLGGELVSQAGEVVVLCEASAVEEATGEVVDVDTSEGVGLARVTSNVQELGVEGGCIGNIGKEVHIGVWVGLGAAVLRGKSVDVF